MRYDDRLNTVLKGAVPEGLAASMQWRQIVDLLAQRPEHLSGDSVSEGLKRLRDLRDRVPVEHRVESVEALGKRLQSAPLLVLLCGDESRVASAAIDACSLSDREIEELLPHLPERAKALMPVPETLRVVQDSSIHQPETLRDIGPNESQIPANEDGEGPSQIRQLVIRISDYQKQRSAQIDEASVPTPLRALRVTNFDFATDPEGVINKVRGIPAGAIVGISISEPAMDEGPGPDAAGAAAFMQRRAVNNGRIRLLGSPQIEGTWRFSAAPRFDEVSGRFAGYEGTMRRPDIDEEAAPQAEPTFDQSQVQQFVHELRTPLNAIVGFSELIEQQLFGPVSFDYRQIAQDIRDEAARLLAVIEDIGSASGVVDVSDPDGNTEAGPLLTKIAERLQPLTERKQIELSISRAEPVRAFASGHESLERIFSRLISACIAACGQGEHLQAALRTFPGREPVNQFWIERPAAAQGISETELLNLSRETDQGAEGGALLGLGFSFRLVRNLAQSLKGRLVIDEHRIILTLPAADTSRRTDRERECD